MDTKEKIQAKILRWFDTKITLFMLLPLIILVGGICLAFFVIMAFIDATNSIKARLRKKSKSSKRKSLLDRQYNSSEYDTEVYYDDQQSNNPHEFSPRQQIVRHKNKQAVFEYSRRKNPTYWHN